MTLFVPTASDNIATKALTFGYGAAGTICTGFSIFNNTVEISPLGALTESAASS